jgi:hypothetical protein
MTERMQKTTRVISLDVFKNSLRAWVRMMAHRLNNVLLCEFHRLAL